MNKITTEFIKSLGFTDVPKLKDHFVLPTQCGYIYLRPSFLGGYYWGICEGETYDYREFYAVEPIQDPERLQKLVEAMTGKAIEKPEVPIHPHDCETCQFLGTFLNKYDLYYRPQSGTIPTLIARWGPQGDYSSGMTFAEADKDDMVSPLGEAFRRARAKNLIRA